MALAGAKKFHDCLSNTTESNQSNLFQVNSVAENFVANTPFQDVSEKTSSETEDIYNAEVASKPMLETIAMSSSKKSSSDGKGIVIEKKSVESDSESLANVKKGEEVEISHLQTSANKQKLALNNESQMLLSGVQTIPEQLPLILTEGDAEEHESLTLIAGNEQLQDVSTHAVLGNNNCTSGLMVFSTSNIAPSGQIIPISGTNLLVLQSLSGQNHQLCQHRAVIVSGQTQDGQKEATVEATEEKSNKEVKVYQCPEPGCNKEAPTSSKLKLHMLSHTGDRPHKCPLSGCHWAFTTAYKLKRHMRGHTGEKPFVCDANNCGKTFTTTYNLKTHQKTHLREQTNVCSYPDCGLSFTTLHRLRMHEKKHVSPNELHTCTFEGCGKQFKSLGNYNTHVKTHTGQRPHACTFEGCGKRFPKASKLKLHVRTHTGERPFVCGETGCDWAFTSAYKLKRHMRKHSGERPYSCPYPSCNKSFTRASHMKAHQMSHTGQKPFVCSYEDCGRGFTAASTLKIHLRKHSGDKPFKCTVEGCDKAYTTGANLRLHQKKHEEKIAGPDAVIEDERVSDQATSIHYVEIGGVNSVVDTSPHSVVSNTPYSVMHSFTGEDFASEDVASLTVVQFSSEETFPPQTPVSTIDTSHGICFQFAGNDSYATTSSHSNASSTISGLSYTVVTPLPSPGAHYVESVEEEASEELDRSSRNADSVNSEGYVMQEETTDSDRYIVREQNSEEYILREQNSEEYTVGEENSEGFIVREDNSPHDEYIVSEQSPQTAEFVAERQSSDTGKSSEDATLPTMVVFTTPEVQPPSVGQVVVSRESSESSLGALTLRERCTSIGQFAPPSVIFQGEESKQTEVEAKLPCDADHSNIKESVSSELAMTTSTTSSVGLPVSSPILNLSLSDDIDKSPVSPFITDVHEHSLDNESTINLQDLR